MGWEVIAAFLVVAVVGIVFGDGFVEPGFEIHSHCGVCIFIDREAGGGVLYEYLTNALFDLSDKGAGAENFCGDEVKSTPARLQADGLLEYFHWHEYSISAIY